jgi:drug/metabolite transporter (DMT)-like permease
MAANAAVPILLATLAAALFGAQVIFAKRGLAYVNPQTGAMITIGTALTIYWLMAPFLLEGAFWRSRALWIFALNGMMHPLLSMYLSFEANHRMGPTVSSTITATTPLFATVGAVLLLGERLTLPILAGTLVTVGGIMVLTWTRSSAGATWAATVLVFPIGAAAVRAFNQVWGKFGLETLPSPYFAGLVSFSISFVSAVTIYRLRTGRLPLRLPRGGLEWNAWGGLCVAGAILSMYSALNAGMVLVVAPIIAAYPLFTLLYSSLLRLEVLGRRTLLGILLVLGGVLWISVT